MIIVIVIVIQSFGQRSRHERSWKDLNMGLPVELYMPSWQTRDSTTETLVFSFRSFPLFLKPVEIEPVVKLIKVNRRVWPSLRRKELRIEERDRVPRVKHINENENENKWEYKALLAKGVKRIQAITPSSATVPSSRPEKNLLCYLGKWNLRSLKLGLFCWEVVCKFLSHRLSCACSGI